MGCTEEALAAEAASWLIEDPEEREEKFRRERIRHHRLIRDLLLDQLGTHNMDILEVGGGPMPVSDLLPFASRVVVDPLSDEYRKVVACPHHVTARGEEMAYRQDFDLAISTNALDHVENPSLVLARMDVALRPGGYMAILCAEDNAITNPHPAHVINLRAELIHEWIDYGYETVWELTFRQHGYRYGWVRYQGKRGQPAFAMLMRKCDYGV